VLAAGLAATFWLRQQRASALIRHYRAERERAALTRQLDILTRYANDIILLIDDQGRVLDANERAVGAYGRSREELIGSNAASLRAPEALESFESEWERAQQEGGVVFETVHQRSDGTKFPVEVSSRAINLEGTVLRQSIVRDISERKEAERKIRRLSSIYEALTEINQAIVRGTTRQELFHELCRVSVEFGQLDFAWVAVVDAHAGIVRPVASHGYEHGYLDGVEFPIAPESPASRGPIAVALREGRTYVCNDVETDPTTASWRDRATRAGFRAIAAFPLSCEGTPVAALAVYAKEARYFDEQTIALLDEMTHDVSFALDSIASDERRAAAEDALRESEEKYRLLFSNEQDALVVFDAQTTRIVETNEAFLTLSGYSQEETHGLSVLDVSAEPDATEVSVAAVRERGSERVPARRFRRRDGSVIWVELGLNSFVWRGRRLVSGIVRDITERKEAEERARLWANVLENTAEGIVITDVQQRILHVNKAFTALTGYAPEEVLGSSPRMLIAGRYDDEFLRAMLRTIRQSGRWQGEMWNRRSNGDTYPGWLSITAVRNAAGELTHFVGIFSDITERKEAAERINFLSNHDALTGLPNRSVMNDLVQQSVAIARRKGTMLALLFLDLDRFKTINDSLGHPVGDALLQQVASRLTATVREEDIIARIGGDEFLILLPELTRGRDAAVVAEKILAAVRDPVVIDSRGLRVTVSMGISVYPDDGSDVPTLIKNADAAMYHAKERGRNNYQFFTSDMNARAFEALAMEMSLRGAVQRDEFKLLYQPQIDATTGSIVAAEALIRWHHPELGLISPAGFIPIAEEHGLIVSIGEWVLRTACQQVRQWMDEGIDVIPIAVNMSSVQFRQAGLAGKVRSILEESGVAPKYIELELTESILMRDAEQAIAVLEELSAMGVSLAIDDFGTGYSSLSYLRRFPIDRLKIDQSFVRDITVNPDAAAIATAIIGMGRTMKLRVVAEGVETAEQLAFLTAERCDELQGFHIARPMEALQLANLLRGGRTLVGGTQGK
ncbi:MAG: EAL domain-containing protein, partial [Thermoanaerobaculia bacterium]